MTAYSSARAVHKTTTAATVDTITLTADRRKSLELLNRDGASEIYATVGTTDNAPAAPTVGGDDTYVLPATICSLPLPLPSSDDVVVKVISTLATAYTVRID